MKLGFRVLGLGFKVEYKLTFLQTMGSVALQENFVEGMGRVSALQSGTGDVRSDASK